MESKFMMKSPLTHVSTSHYDSYALQLSMYQLMIERNTSVRIGARKVLWLDHYGNYAVIELPYMREECLAMIEKWKGVQV